MLMVCFAPGVEQLMANNLDVNAELEKLRAELELQKQTTKVAVEGLQKQIELTKSIAALELEVKMEFGRLKWIGSAVAVGLSIIGSIAGIIGYHSVQDYIKVVRTEATHQLERINSYYYDYTKGNALLIAGRPGEAIPFLRRCFDQSP